MTKRLLLALALTTAFCPTTLRGAERNPRPQPDAPPPPPRIVTPRPRQSLWERVEDAWDRGNRRVTDEPTYQVQRLQNDRDERLGRIPPQRPTERFQEEYDRRLRLDRVVPGYAGQTSAPPSPADPLPRVSADPATASMAWMLEEDQRMLAKMKADYERGAEAAARQHERARQAARTDAERAAIDRQYEWERSESTRKYEAKRRAILGWPPIPQSGPTTGPTPSQVVR